MQDKTKGTNSPPQESSECFVQFRSIIKILATVYSPTNVELDREEFKHRECTIYTTNRK